MTAFRDQNTIEEVACPAQCECCTPRRPGVLLSLHDISDRVQLAAFLDRQGFDVWTTGSDSDGVSIYLEHIPLIDVIVIEDDSHTPPHLKLLTRFESHFPSDPVVFLINDPQQDDSDLELAGVMVLPRTISPALLADRLWESLAFGIEAVVHHESRLVHREIIHHQNDDRALPT